MGTGGPEGLRNGAPVGLYAGIAPDARLVDCKVLTDAGEGSGAAQALEWCIAHRDVIWTVPSADAVYRGVQVVNMSLGGATASDGTDADCAAVNAAVKAGIVVCVATGNDGNTQYMPSPAAADLDIACGSFQDNNTIGHADDVVADYSNEGPRMDDGDTDHFDEMKPSVCGSGTDIYSALGDPTTDGRHYHNINGTSMATPTVVGVCALILQANPNLSPTDVRTLIQNTAEHRTDHGKQAASASDPFHLDPNYHPSWGWGQPDAVAAVEEALNPFTTQVTEEGSTGSALVAGHLQVGIRWVTQREIDVHHFVVWRAPDLGGTAGTFAAASGAVAPVGHALIEKVGNRTSYSYSDQDPSLAAGASYWYQVRWYEAGGAEHIEPAFQVKTAVKPVRARVSWAITHNSYDSDLVVLYGSGVGTGSPAFVRPTPGTPLADSTKVIVPIGFGGATTEYFFHADLTDDDLVAGFLPPSAANPWFLSALEKGYVNTEGVVDSFSVAVYSGSSATVYRAANPPTATVETQTTVFWIPSNPALALNHSPVISPVGNRTVGEGLHLNFTVQASDPDGDALTYSSGSLPPGATYNTSSHVFDWMPTFGQAGSYTVKFFATDPSLAADTETVQISVYSRAPGSNTAPTLQSIADKTVHVESFLTFTVSAADPEGDAMTYSASPLPSGASFNASDRSFNWLPHSGAEGSYHVTFRVFDAHGAADSQSVLISVQPGSAHLPPQGGCVPDSVVYTGTIGTGVQGTMSDTKTVPFVIPSGTGAVQGALYWTGAPAIDLDFFLLDGQGNMVNSSASLNEPEVVTVLDPAPGNYTWKVVAFNNPVANLAYSITSTLCHRTATGIGGTAPGNFALSPNSPNPFARATTIRFSLARPGAAMLRIFDVQGRVARTLVQGAMGPGAYQRVWDGKRDDGAAASAGIYFYRLETGEGTLSKKMMLLR